MSSLVHDMWWLLFNLLARDSFGAPSEWFVTPPWWHLALVALATVILASVASAVPARLASRVEIVHVLRFE